MAGRDDTWRVDGQGARPRRQSFDDVSMYVFHACHLVSHDVESCSIVSIFTPEVCLCPQMALSANRFFVQSDTQDSCGFTTRAFQAHSLDGPLCL